MITTRLKLRPFTVPNFVIPESQPVRRQDGPKFSDGIPVHELDDDTIRQLITQFQADLWEKVIKRRAAADKSGASDEKETL